jgi:hypothetical protein
MHSPLVEPVLNGKEVGLEFLGGSCYVHVLVVSLSLYPFFPGTCYRALLYPPSLPNTPFAECIVTDCK